MNNNTRNFHGWIGIWIEEDAKRILGMDDCRSSFVSADWLEIGTFAEAMLFILRSKFGYDKDLTDFSLCAQRFLGEPVNKFTRDELIDIYNLYKKILNEAE